MSGAMYVGFDGFVTVQNVTRLTDFACGSVYNDQKFVQFERVFVFENTVFRDADAVKRGAHDAYPANQRSSLKRADDPPHDRTADNNRADAGHHKKRRAEQQPPEAAPECAQLAQYPIRSPVL